MTIEQHPVIQALITGEQVSKRNLNDDIVTLAVTRYNEKTGEPYQLEARFRKSDLLALRQNYSDKATKLNI